MSRKCVDIGYYGGSFDMPTVGHTQMAENFLKSGEIGRLIVSPAGPHAHGKKYSVSNEHRIAMAEIMTADLQTRCGKDRVLLSLSEIESTQVSFTYKALQELGEKYAGAQIAALIGQDCLGNFHLWNDYQAILRDYLVLVHPRIESSGQLLPGMKMIEAPTVNGASGVVKERIAKGESIDGWLLPEIHDYISTNHLYGIKQ